MLHRHINIEHISFVDLSSHHRLVNRHRNLFPGTRLAHSLSLILDPDDLSDPLSITVDQRILWLDDPIEHFDSDNGRIVTPEDESFQQLYLALSYGMVHLGL